MFGSEEFLDTMVVEFWVKDDELLDSLGDDIFQVAGTRIENNPRASL